MVEVDRGLFTRFKRPQTAPEIAPIPEFLNPDMFAIFTFPNDDTNQDTAFAIPSVLSIGTLDGAGGYNAGREASACASTALQHELHRLPRNASLRKTIKHAERSMLAGHQSVLDAVREDETGEKQGMKTGAATATLWQGKDGSTKVIFAWVGDVGGYIGDENGVEKVTSADDGIKFCIKDKQKVKAWQDQLDNAETYSDLEDEDDTLTLDFQVKIMRGGQEVTTNIVTKKDFFNNQNLVTQFLGGKLNRVNIEVRDVKPGQVVILPTDGMKTLTTREMGEIVKEEIRQDPRAQNIADGLGEAAVAKEYEPWSHTNIRPNGDHKTASVMIVPPHPNSMRA